MNPKLKSMHGELEANLKKIEDLLGRGNDMTDADFATAKDLKAQNEGLVGKINDLVELQKGQTAHNEFLNAPANKGIPMPGVAQVEDWQPAGKAFVDQKTGQMIQEGKMGLISEKQFKAISQKSYLVAFGNMIKSGGIHMMNSMTEIKLLQEGIDDQGGFLVPADVMARLITKEPVPTSTLANVRKLDTTRDRIQIPKVVYSTDNKYTTPVRVTWTGEVPASSTAHRATQPTFGLFETDVHTGMLSLPVTNDQIEDSMIGLMEYLTDAFGQTIELLGEDLILNGTGVKQPHGILENPGGSNEPAVVVTGSASALTADGLKDAQYGVPPQYQQNARWIMSWMNTAKAIEKLKDSQNRYLWGEGVQQSGLSQSAYDRPLLSRAISYNEFAPTPGANTYPVVYGDLMGYYWVRRVGFSIQVLNEVYAEVNQKMLLGRVRLGGDVAEDWRMIIHKCST